MLLQIYPSIIESIDHHEVVPQEGNIKREPSLDCQTQSTPEQPENLDPASDEENRVIKKENSPRHLTAHPERIKKNASAMKENSPEASGVNKPSAYSLRRSRPLKESNRISCQFCRKTFFSGTALRDHQKRRCAHTQKQPM